MIDNENVDDDVYDGNNNVLKVMMYVVVDDV